MNRTIIGLSTAAVLAFPAFASADKPTTTHAPKGNAYGKYCQAESKKHVAGEKGTAFSRCVKAAKVVAETETKAKDACADLSKKHVKGEKGTAFSRCVVAAAQAEKDAEA